MNAVISIMLDPMQWAFSDEMTEWIQLVHLPLTLLYWIIGKWYTSAQQVRDSGRRTDSKRPHGFFSFYNDFSDRIVLFIGEEIFLDMYSKFPRIVTKWFSQVKTSHHKNWCSGGCKLQVVSKNFLSQGRCCNRVLRILMKML